MLNKQGASDPFREAAQIPKLLPSIIKALHGVGGGGWGLGGLNGRDLIPLKAENFLTFSLKKTPRCQFLQS